MGPKGKARDVLVGWIRLLFAHNDNRLVPCSPQLWLLLLDKRGNTLHALVAAKKFHSTNIAKRILSSTCINIAIRALVTSRQFYN